MLPWLEETFQRLDRFRGEYASLQERLSEAVQGSGAEADTGNGDESALAKATADRLVQQIEDGVEEILDRGIIVRQVEKGLVDFPSLREGREVHLCWIRGEFEIGFWHDTDRGFAHREPL